MDDPNLKPSTALPLSPAAMFALQQGNKIEAIKIVREERNIGLKEAKDAVDDYMRSQPSLSSSPVAAKTDVIKNVLVWLAIAIVFLILWDLIPAKL